MKSRSHSKKNLSNRTSKPNLNPRRKQHTLTKQKNQQQYNIRQKTYGISNITPKNSKIPFHIPLSLFSSNISPLERLKRENEQNQTQLPALTTKSLNQEHPQTSTKFQRKIREGDSFTVSDQKVDNTTWDFHSLVGNSLFDVKQTTKEEASSAVSVDDGGYISENIDRLTQMPTLTLAEMAYGYGKYAIKKPKVTSQTHTTNNQQQEEHSDSKKKHDNDTNNINNEIENQEYNDTIAKLKAESKETKTTLLQVDEDFNIIKAFREADPESNMFRGFTDPIAIPAIISKPKLVNPIAGRALGYKLNLEYHQFQAQDAENEHNSTMKRASLLEQSTLWFARASYAGDADSSLQMAQFCENKLNIQLRLYGENDDSPDQSPTQNNNDNDEDVVDVESRRDLPEETKLEVEIAYEEVSKALIPRLRGLQLQGVDYQTTHPLISTLYYFEQYLEQSKNIFALAQFCEWFLGLDELFAEVLDDEILESELSGFTDKKVDDLFAAPIQHRIRDKKGLLSQHLARKEQPSSPIPPSSSTTQTTDQNTSAHDPTTLHEEIQPINNQSASSVDAQIISSSNDGNTDITNILQHSQHHNNSDTEDSNEYGSHNYFYPATFLGIYLQVYLRPLTLHPVFGPDAMILLSRLLRIYGDRQNEADELESIGIQQGGLTIEERIEQYHITYEQEQLF